MHVYTRRMGNVSDTRIRDSGASLQAVALSRADMAKSRHTAETKSGDRVGINLERGVVLRDGDILRTENAVDPRIVVSQMPEKVIRIKFQNYEGDDDIGHKDCHVIPFLLGHVIGNMHRPVSIDDGRNEGGGMTASVPIQDDSELETFRRILAPISGDITLDISEEVFTPHEGADVHGHN